MPHVVLRKTEGSSSPDDLTVTVQDKTFDYLRTTITREVRVSCYLEKDCERVDSNYAELFVEGATGYIARISRVIPGSRTRTSITLPGPMFAGEQLTVEVERVLGAQVGHLLGELDHRVAAAERLASVDDQHQDLVGVAVDADRGPRVHLAVVDGLDGPLVEQERERGNRAP